MDATERASSGTRANQPNQGPLRKIAAQCDERGNLQGAGMEQSRLARLDLPTKCHVHRRLKAQEILQYLGREASSSIAGLSYYPCMYSVLRTLYTASAAIESNKALS